MDHTIIPQEWKKFLSNIQTLYPDAIIAGGALRDTILDVPIKDVDIFISDCEVDINAIAEMFAIKALDIGHGVKEVRDHIVLSHDLKARKCQIIDQITASTFDDGGPYNEKANKSSYNSYSSDPNCDFENIPVDALSMLQTFITQIYDVQYNGVLYQLIFVEQDPVVMVYKDFDFGICKIYYDGKDLVLTDEFNYDCEHKQITFCGKFSVGQILHTLLVHRPNICKKFPNWKVVIEEVGKKAIHEMPKSYQDLINDAKESKNKPDACESPPTDTALKIIAEHPEYLSNDAKYKIFGLTPSKVTIADIKTIADLAKPKYEWEKSYITLPLDHKKEFEIDWPAIEWDTRVGSWQVREESIEDSRKIIDRIAQNYPNDMQGYYKALKEEYRKTEFDAPTFKYVHQSEIEAEIKAIKNIDNSI